MAKFALVCLIAGILAVQPVDGGHFNRYPNKKFDVAIAADSLANYLLKNFTCDNENYCASTCFAKTAGCFAAHYVRTTKICSQYSAPVEGGSILKTISGTANEISFGVANYTVYDRPKPIKDYPLVTPKWYSDLIEAITTPCSFPEPLGVAAKAQAGAVSPSTVGTWRIRDDQITSSSATSNQWAGNQGRLHHQWSWCPSSPNTNSWWQVSFDDFMWIHSFSIKGHSSKLPFTVYFQYATDYDYFTNYQELGQVRTFQGGTQQSDWDTVYTFQLKNPVLARAIRINPRTWFGGDYCMQAEVYGCHAIGFEPLGIHSYEFPDESFDAHDWWPDRDWMPYYSQLLNRQRSWHSGDTAVSRTGNGWLQVDMQKDYIVTGVMVQPCRQGWNNYYWISVGFGYCSGECQGDFEWVRDASGGKTFSAFPGSIAHDRLRGIMFPKPIIARKIRMWIRQSTPIHCGRWEILGLKTIPYRFAQDLALGKTATASGTPYWPEMSVATGKLTDARTQDETSLHGSCVSVPASTTEKSYVTIDLGSSQTLTDVVIKPTRTMTSLDPIGLWLFDYATWTQDLSGNGNDGDARNVNLVTGPFGNPLGAMEIGGKFTSGIVIGNSRYNPNSLFSFTNGFSAFIWVYPYTTAMEPLIHFTKEEGGCCAFILWTMTGGTMHTNWYGSASTNTPVQVLTQNAWNFVGLVYDRNTGNLNFYVNHNYGGSLYVGNADPYVQSLLAIGRSWYNDARQFSGRVSCLQIYNRVLTREELNEAKRCPWATPIPVLFWLFDSTSGSTDAYGSGIAATVGSVSITSGLHGIPDTAYSFSGSAASSLTYANGAGQVDVRNGMTIAFWFNRAMITGPESLVAYIDPNNAAQALFQIQLASNGISIYTTCLNYPGWNVTFATKSYIRPIQMTRWRYMAVTYDITTAKLILYHEMDALFSRKLPDGCQLPTGGSLRIGGMPSSQYFSGGMACFQIHKRPLTPRELTQVSQCPKTKITRAVVAIDQDPFSWLKDVTGNAPESQYLQPRWTVWDQGPFYHWTHGYRGGDYSRMSSLWDNAMTTIQQFTENFSLMLFVNVYSLGTETHFITIGSGYASVIVGMRSSNVLFAQIMCTSGGTTHTITSTVTIGANKWYHIALVRSRTNNNMQLFFNGYVIASGNGGTCTLPTTTSYHLMSNWWNSGASSINCASACFVGFREAVNTRTVHTVMGACPGQLEFRPTTCEFNVNQHTNMFYEISSKLGHAYSDASIDSSTNFWSPASPSSSEWYGMTFVNEFELRSIITRGHPGSPEWVTTYTMWYFGSNSLPGGGFMPNWDGTGTRIFPGNSDQNGAAENQFAPSIRVKRLRVYPQTWQAYPSLRLGARGCFVAVCNQRLHYNNYEMAVSASSAGSNHATATLESDGVWLYSPPRSDNGWIQIVFGNLYKIVRVSTRGGGSTANAWVTIYRISYTINGDAWTAYKTRNGFVRYFTGNSEANKVYDNSLNPPIYARGVRFHPEWWSSQVAMRIGVWGCQPDFDENRFPAFDVTLGDNAVNSVATALSNPKVTELVNPLPYGDREPIHLFMNNLQAKGRYLSLVTKVENQQFDVCQVSAYNYNSDSMAVRRGVVLQSSAFPTAAAAFSKAATDGATLQYDAESAGQSCIVGWSNLIDEWQAPEGQSIINGVPVSACAGKVAQWEMMANTQYNLVGVNLYLAQWNQVNAGATQWSRISSATIKMPPQIRGKYIVDHGLAAALNVVTNKSLGYYHDSGRSIAYMSSYIGVNPSMFSSAASVPTARGQSIFQSDVDSQMISPGYVTYSSTSQQATMIKGFVTPATTAETWMAVDMGAPVQVSRVWVYMPVDRFGNSLANTEIRIGNDITTVTNNKLCDAIGNIFMDNRNTQRPFTYYCLRPIRGRYVVLRRTTFGLLPVSEILVYA